MSISVIYALFCVVVLPPWIVQQHLGGRSIPFILATCGYVLYSLVAGVNIPVDNITLIVGCIAAWLTASLVWSDTKRSTFELFNLLACLVLFMAARTIPLMITAFAVFSMGTVFAALETYYVIKRRRLPAVDETISFGNGNHTGAFMLTSLFAGLWLTVNLSMWFIPFLFCILFTLIISRCKGAILGGIVAVIAILFVTGAWQISALILSSCVAYVLRLFGTIPNVKASIGGRIWIHLAAIEMIVKKPLTGWGLDSYRKELPDINAKIQKGKLYDYVGEKLNDNMNTRSHRVHNDHLEIMAEAGIPCYLLFVYLFSSIAYDPIILGLFIAFIIHALFFFPFREVHTAVPFWVIMGSVAGGKIGVVTMPLLVKSLIACFVVVVVIQTLHKFLGQWYSEKAKRTTGITEKEKLECIDIALLHDPHNGGYLSDAAFYYSKVDQVKAFSFAQRAFVGYDGKRVKHGICDLFARCLIGAGIIKVCHWAEDQSLWLQPDFAPAQTIKKYLFMEEAKRKP